MSFQFTLPNTPIPTPPTQSTPPNPSKHPKPHSTNITIEWAAENGQLETLKALISNAKNYGSHFGTSPSGEQLYYLHPSVLDINKVTTVAMRKAAKRGHLHCVSYLHNTFSHLRKDPNVIHIAATNGQCDIVSWCVDNCYYILTDTIVKSVEAGYPSIARILFQHLLKNLVSCSSRENATWICEPLLSGESEGEESGEEEWSDSSEESEESVCEEDEERGGSGEKKRKREEVEENEENIEIPPPKGVSSVRYSPESKRFKTTHPSYPSHDKIYAPKMSSTNYGC